jgi:hypothetical protein
MAAGATSWMELKVACLRAAHGVVAPSDCKACDQHVATRVWPCWAIVATGCETLIDMDIQMPRFISAMMVP